MIVGHGIPTSGTPVSGSGSAHGTATCGCSASLTGRLVSGRPAGRATGGCRNLRSSSVPCPSATGPISVWCRSAIGSVASGRTGEPPDADPHVRWCGRGRCDAAPYPILAGQADAYPLPPTKWAIIVMPVSASVSWPAETSAWTSAALVIGMTDGSNVPVAMAATMRTAPL